MSPEIKAVVFKTAQLKETKHFFETVLHFKIKETSARHFLISSKGVRIIFLESKERLEIQMYVSDKSNNLSFKNGEDPNGINIIVAAMNHFLK